jgi:hypothetical protein
VFFDESSVLDRTDIGTVLMEGAARFSRYLGTIPDMASQGVAELIRYAQHFTTRMIFRITDPDKQADALEFVGWPNNEENREILATLGDGECIFRDLYLRTATVQIVTPLAEYQPAFDTTLDVAAWELKYGEILRDLAAARQNT